MRVVLVGDDGSDAAARAVEWANRLAADTGARLLVVQVTRDGIGTHYDGPGELVEVTDRHPASALMTTADERDADIIVLGRRGSGGFPSLPIGTTANCVAAASGRAVAVVPPERAVTDAPLVRRVVMGLDGLSGSAAAAGWAALQWPDAQFTAVHVSDVARTLAPLGEDLRGDLDQRAHARASSLMQGEWIRPLADAGVAVEPVVAAGDPSDELLRLATERDADTVVVGRRDHHLMRGTLGGVSQRVIAYAPCAAIVVSVRP
jgi:nucleotide-binding universal stress UspA family protein